MSALNVNARAIFCHDNLEVLRGINSACIDLIYLDPPFNKKKVFMAPLGSSASGASFSDIFTRADIKSEWGKSIEYENPQLYSYLHSVHAFSNQYNYCYLVYMAIRLLECRRLLKPAGSIYLHCDATMSHYLKIMMDYIFGEKHFRNEIIWCYHGPGSPKMRQFNRKHDVILWYSKGKGWVFNKDAVKVPHKDGGPHTGGYGITPEISERCGKQGKEPESWWVMRIAARSKTEYTGYPTQKPLMLLERIIKAGSNEGDVVLDPFCGCATTCIAAERLNRRWVGIDVSVKAYDLVRARITKETDNLLDVNKVIAYSAEPPRRTDAEDADAEAGYVYIISNANWPNIHKVGIAKDPAQRLNSYQTSDPYRACRLEYTLQTRCCKEIERAIHKQFKAANEWIKADVKAIKKAIAAWEDSLNRQQ